MIKRMDEWITDKYIQARITDTDMEYFWTQVTNIVIPKSFCQYQNLVIVSLCFIVAAAEASFRLSNA